MQIRTKIRVIVVTAATLSIGSAGMSNYSFRINGMGGSILDFTHDPYSDVFYNPAYIANIQGLQVYTNLSNLNSKAPASILGNEFSMMKNAIYPSNMVGFMGRWEFLSGGAFYVSEGYNFNFETTSNNKDQYEWDDENGSYIERNLSDFQSNSSFNLGGRQIIGIGTVNLFGFRIGILGKIRTFKGSITFESEEKRKKYEDDKLTYNRTSNHTNNITSGTTFFGLVAGTVIGGENTELSISGGIQPGGASISSKYIDEWIRKPFYSSYYYQYDQDPSKNFKVNYDKNNYDLSVLGSEIFVNARLMKKVGPSTRTSIFGRGSTALFPVKIVDEYKEKYEAKKPDGYYQYSDSFVDTSYGYYQLDEEINKQNGEGSVNFIQLKAGIGIEHQFENNTLFILGIKGNYIHTSGSIDINPRVKSIIYKDLYNNPEGENIGYIQTTDYRNPVTMKGSGNTIFLEIPSALEFTLTDKWIFRVGSNQIVPLYGSGKYSVSVTDKPDETTIKYTDGPNAGITVTSISEDVTQFEEGEIKLSSNNFNLSRYYTGLGYLVNENISIDIIHYSNLVDLNSWYISFLVNFK